jgi:hypothetical protein
MKMNDNTKVAIRNFCLNTGDPVVIESGMMEACKLKLKYTAKWIALDRMKELIRRRIGTTQVENLAKKVEGQEERKVETVMYIMKRQAENIKKVIVDLKRKIFLKIRSLEGLVNMEWKRKEMKEILQQAANEAWNKSKETMMRSVRFLQHKFRDISNRDSDTGPIDSDYQVIVERDMTEEERVEDKKLDKAISIGMELTPDEEAYLKVPSSMNDFEEVNVVKAVTDISRMAVKIRRELRKRADEKKDSETDGRQVEMTEEEREKAEEEEMLRNKVHNKEEKSVDFSKMRVTQMKSCRRVFLPKHLDGRTEAKIDTLVGSLEEAVKRQQKREKKSKPSSVYTEEELRGRDSLKKKEKEGLGVIASSDKSGKKIWVETESYESKIGDHTRGDKIIEMKKVDKIEIRMSAMSSSWARVLKIGQSWNQEERVQAASKARYTKIPTLDALIKDHKDVPIKDLPIRPVCRAAQSPNGILSEIISDLLKVFADEIAERQGTEVTSTEEMCEKIMELNKVLEAEEEGLTAEEIKLLKEVVIGSKDAKALYPSLEAEHSAKIIEQQVLESELEIEIDERALIYHMAATHTQEEIVARKLEQVCPTRTYSAGTRPGITSRSVTGTAKEREESDVWIEPQRSPTREEVRSILAAVVGHAVKDIMTNHVYTACGSIYLQTDGGSIGLRATSEISRLVCLKFDQLLKKKLNELRIVQLMYARYVDDSNSAYVATEPGLVFEEGELVMKEERIEADRMEPPDRRTFRVVQEVANSIWTNIQWTFDVPSNYSHEKMPVLDLQVGLKDRRAQFEYYEKAVSTRYTIPSRSAHSWQVKRSTLTQEGVRRMLNTDPSASNSTRRKILERWDHKMLVSGYPERFRRQVLSASIGIYKDKIAKAAASGAPLYRPRSWQAQRREKEKALKVVSWYRSRDKIPNIAPLIMNPTKDGILKKEAEKICELFKETHQLGIKIMERAGRKSAADLTSNHKGLTLCARENCMICRVPGSKGGCRGQGMAYTQTCLACPNGKGREKESSVYYGETGKSNYERGTSHLKDLRDEVEDTPLWKHCQLLHEGTHVKFQMKTTGSFPICEERQSDEGSRVKTSEAKHVLNSKSEWHQPPISRIVVDTGNAAIVQGGAGLQGGARSNQGARGRGGRRGRGRGAGRQP